MRFTDVQIGDRCWFIEQAVVVTDKHPVGPSSPALYPCLSVRFADGREAVLRAGALISDADHQQRVAAREAQAAYETRAAGELAAAVGDPAAARLDSGWGTLAVQLRVTISQLDRLLDRLDARPVPAKDRSAPPDAAGRQRRRRRLSRRLRAAVGAGYSGDGQDRLTDGQVAGVWLSADDAVMLARRLTGGLPEQSALAELLTD